MSTAGNTPNFIAEQAVYPFRCVTVGSAPFKAVPSTTDPEILLGVTDGSIRNFNSTYHALAGQPISLQNAEFVQLTAGGTIAVGDTLIASTDGKVVASTTGTEYFAQAVDNATDGEIFWAKRIGAWTVGGGGGGGTMTIDVQEFDDPEAENAWVKPAGAVTVMVQMCGAGQDGGVPGVTALYGGNAGCVAQKQMDASLLPASVPVTIGVHQPFATASNAGTSAFGTYVYAGMGAWWGPSGADQGGSTVEFAGLQSDGSFAFGQGSNEDVTGNSGARQGGALGPGGGGGSFGDIVTRNGAAPATNLTVAFYTFTMTIASGGGGAGGASDGIGPGGNGGNGSIDPVTGFGGGGGGGGAGGPLEDGGDGGNGIHGGGGGAGGQAGAGGNPGFPGIGGDGYVRVTTICFN